MQIFRLADDLTVTRMGYGAMQLAGPGVWGPPRDRDAAVAVLRDVVDLGLTHIDTSDFYGPHTVNEVIREALHPHPDDLHIVTKVGATRAADKSWPPALSREDLTAAVEDNLYLRAAGKIRHLGVSNVTPTSWARPARSRRRCASRTCTTSPSAVTTPWWTCAPPTASRSCRSSRSAGSRPCSPARWTTARSAWTPPRGRWRWPGLLLIPGTSSVEHLRDNVSAASLELPADVLADLDGIGRIR